MAKLYFRYGAMNSGKSTSLMQVAYNYEERGMKIILMKPETDTKGGDKVLSRLGVDRKVDVIVKKEQNIFELLKERLSSEDIHCILVDEAQFLKSHHVDELFKIAVIKDVPVICYGLRTDFQMNGFEGSQRLLLIAHSLEEMKTICACGRKAILNGRKINSRFVFEGEQVAIDKTDNVEYESLCGKCYFEQKGEYEK